MKILLVDDNEGLVDVLRLMLESEGNEVKTAHNGREGYSTYLLFKPELVVTDIQMPVENGLKLMEQIRAHDPDIRTVYMSAEMSQYQPFLEAKDQKHHWRFLEKPFSKEELINSVNRL